MDLRRIRHFHVLAETLNFSRAAERLHIAQPALSVSIQKLESELGTLLFERTSTGVSLTSSGQAVLVEARRMLYHSEQMQRLAQDASQGTGGSLRVGFVGSAIYKLLPLLVPAFRAEYPSVELVLRESISSRIVESLAEEALDVGIVRTPLLLSTTAQLLTLQRDPFLLAMPQDHPLACKDSLQVADMAREPFVMYAAAEASGLHGAVMALCQSVGFVPRVAQEASQVPTVLALVESGLGVALVPEVMRGYRAPGVVYRELSDLPQLGVTTLALAWQPGMETPAALRFIDLARRHAVS
jgi:DNA-binding transcriptional LysR family regulator